jgi:hypothetical protein
MTQWNYCSHVRQYTIIFNPENQFLRFTIWYIDRYRSLFFIERSHSSRPNTKHQERKILEKYLFLSSILPLSFEFARDKRVGNKVVSFKLGLCTLIDAIKIKNTPYTCMSFAFLYLLSWKISQTKSCYIFLSKLVNYEWHTSSFYLFFLKSGFGNVCGARWLQPSLDAVGRKSDNPSGSQSKLRPLSPRPIPAQQNRAPL